MNHYKIYFSNGDNLSTGFNGTINQAEEYYVGNEFNLGNGDNDVITKGIKVEEVE